MRGSWELEVRSWKMGEGSRKMEVSKFLFPPFREGKEKEI